MAIQSIHLGPVEDFLQFDDTEFYSDGSTPRGLIVPIKPTTNNGVVRKIDLNDSTVNPLADESYLVMALSGDLSNERKLTAGIGVALADGGAGGNATISIGQAVETNSNVQFNSVEIDGDLNHDGSNVGFFGTAPAAQSTGWSASNVTPDKSFDADSTSIDELADVLGTLIDYLKTIGILGA